MVPGKMLMAVRWEVHNPFHTKQEKRNSCCNQEGRRGSNDVVWGTWVLPSSEACMLGTLGVPSWVPSTVLHFSRNVGLLLRL